MTYDRRSLYERVYDLLSENPLRTLLDLSEELTVNRHTIEEVVQEIGGLSFRELRTVLIHRKVKTLFAIKPSLSIKEVAFRVGYKSASAFARFTKKTTGKTPSELRNQEWIIIPVPAEPERTD